MYTKRLIDSVKGYQNAFGKIMDLCEAAPSGEDRQLLIAHSERLIFYTQLFYFKAGPEARAACRPVIDTYMGRARAVSGAYCPQVRSAIACYAGELPETEVRLPEIPCLCYA